MPRATIVDNMARAPKTGHVKRSSGDVAELRRLNWALAACASSTSALIHGANAGEVMNKVCEAIVSQGAYIAAAVGLAEASPGKPVRIDAVAGPASAYCEGLEVSWAADDPRGVGPAGLAIRNGEPWITCDIRTDEAFAPWRARGEAFGIRSCLVVPFGSGGAALGALVVYADHADAFGPAEMALFQQLADELAFAIGLDAERRRLAKAELALRESEARYRSLFDHAPDGLIVISAEGAYIDVNARACAMLGYARGEFLGLRSYDILDEDQLPMVAIAAEEIRAKGVFRRAWRLIRKDGSRISTEVVTTQMPNGAFVSIIHDMTDHDSLEAGRVAAEDALREARSILARIGRAAALGEVVTTIAHEVNQPLAAIVLHADAARRWMTRPQPEIGEAREALAAIARDAQRASEVIRRTRAFLSGSLAELSDFDLNSALEEVAAMSRSEQRRAGVKVRFALTGGLPLVRADRPQIQQVTLNLVLNAIDSMALVEGRTRLLTIGTALQEDDAVLVTVKDTGRGLNPSTSGRLFEQFYTTKPHGAGIGLSISRSLIQAHGGRIWATAGADHGALFQFTIPRPGEAAS